MIGGYEERSRRQHSPIPIARQKRQRAEDVEVRLNSSACQMNQQTGEADLANGYCLSREGASRKPPDEEHRAEAENPTQNCRGIKVRMHGTGRSVPGAW